MVIIGVYIRSEIRLPSARQAKGFPVMPAFSQALSSSGFIGTKHPITRLIARLSRKLFKNSTGVKFPEENVPMKDKHRLSVIPIIILICDFIFFSIKIPPLSFLDIVVYYYHDTRIKSCLRYIFAIHHKYIMAFFYTIVK